MVGSSAARVEKGVYIFLTKVYGNVFDNFVKEINVRK